MNFLFIKFKKNLNKRPKNYPKQPKIIKFTGECTLLVEIIEQKHCKGLDIVKFVKKCFQLLKMKKKAKMAPKIVQNNSKL